MNTEPTAFLEGAAALLRPERRTLRLVGPDRARYLNGQISADLSQLQPGQGVRALKPSPRGRVEGMMRVRAYADRYELDLDQPVFERVATGLERFIIMDDCQLREVSADRAVVAVYGPRAAEVLAGVGFADAEGLANLAFFEKAGWTVIRDGLYGVDGFELYGPPGEGPDRLARLVNAGATAVQAEAFEVFRVEAGVPKDGVDVDEEIIPMEAGLDAWVSLEKGCYVGQEVIARATNFGGVKHRLVHLYFQGHTVPAPKTPLYAPGADKATGEVRSAVDSPRLGHGVGLGYVRIIHEPDGTILELRDGDRKSPVTVHPRPR